MSHAHQESQSQEKKPHRFSKIVLHPLAIGFIVLAISATVVYTALQMLDPNSQKINRAQYQAIYTTSGQLFFGMLQNTNGKYLTLKSPYTAQKISSAGNSSTPAEDTTTLVKVSSQVYGPDDSMAIQADQVVFWQNLRDDSKVVQAIKAKQ